MQSTTITLGPIAIENKLSNGISPPHNEVIFGFQSSMELSPLCWEYPQFGQKLVFSGTSVPHLTQNDIISPFVEEFPLCT